MTESLTSRFGHKIKSRDELKAIIGPRPREKTVIMCHGVFDIVHPGHIRHLMFASDKADILIASLTADKHIDKGTYRPHVPQDLRAANLAAFEFVDFVLVDANAKPLENIEYLQPDLFAKGFEYVSSDLGPKTAEEQEILDGYGGELIFTPGDVVYSSSKLIDLAPPELKLEKLATVMDGYDITFDSLRRTVDRMADKKVHVLGDTIVDSLTQCAMIGGKSKTPTMSVLFENRTDYLGGAAVVAKHLRAAGANVVFSTVLGDDDLKPMVLQDLAEIGVDARPVIDPIRPTTNKNAIVVDGYRLLKIDTLDNAAISDGVLEELRRSLQDVAADAVVFSDFRHGIFNRRTIGLLIESTPDGVFRVADSQVASRWGNITEFQGFDLITPNEREARFALADQDSGIRPLASELYDRSGCTTLILKLGERGVLTCCTSDHEAHDSFFIIDSFVENLVDAVGAGDALLAYATLASLVSKVPAEASILGSIAAACECEMDGNVPVSSDDVLTRLAKIEKRTKLM